VTETELARQQEVIGTFLQGLVDAFDFDATLSTSIVLDDEAVDATIEGSELGLPIGPKGQTLQAVQELARSVVQRKMPAERHGRIRIDVAGYRQRRREALERFARQVADDVLATGTTRALEPMSAADRKVVHDTVNENDGVRTISEGEEPRRRVVVAPAESDDERPDAAEADEFEAGDDEDQADEPAADAEDPADPAGT
jgi:spoIIIJ-associated protein